MKYLLLSLGVLIVLVVLYLVARRVKPFGQSIAFVCTAISRVNVKLAEYMTKAADYCNKVCLASLHYPPGVGDSDYWSGVNVLSRLVYFVLAVCILVGETVNTLLVLPSLFQTANHVQLPGIVELASAALFICTPALFGAVMLECCGLIPHGAGLFPRMHTVTRWVLGVLSGVFLLLAIFLTGYFYLYRAAYLLNPESTQGMSLYILCGLGLLIAAVSVLALVALVVGGCGVVSLLMWVVEHGCRVFASTALLLPSVLNVLVVHLSHGTRNVFEDYDKPGAYQSPPLEFPLSRESLPGQPSIVLLPNHALAEDTNLVTIFPELTTEKEKDMSNPDKNAAIVFEGEYGSQMRTPIEQKIIRYGATDSILTSAHVDLSTSHMQTGIAGTVDVSPTSVERNTATLRGGTEGQINNTLLCCTGDKLTAIHVIAKALPAPLLFLTDCRNLVDGVEMHESIKPRLPLHPQVVVTSVSEKDVHDKTVQAGLADMQSLAHQDIIAQVIVTDPRSSFALKYGEETLNQFLALFLVGMLIAQKHSPRNGSCIKLLQALHSLSPFSTLSFASEPVAVGEMPKRWSWVPLVKGHAGVGNFSDVLAQTRAAIDRCFRDEITRTFPAEVSTDASCIVICTAPYARNDRRFQECVRANALYVGTHYPYATCLTLSGNGCVYPYHMGSKFLVTASLLYPLHPATFPKLHPGKQQPVTSVFPVPHAIEPTNGDGNTSIEPSTNEVKQTPVPSRQAKNAAPARRGRPKHTKAAK